MTRRYAEVIVDVYNRKVDRSFHYAVPDHLDPEIGSRVLVDFNHRTLEGIVVAFSTQAPVDTAKPIIACLETEPLLTRELVELARWMAEYYICPFIQSLQSILPVQLGVRQEITVRPLVTSDDPGVSAYTLLDPEAAELFIAISKRKKPVKLSNLAKRFGKAAVTRLNEMSNRGIVAFGYEIKEPKVKVIPAAAVSQRPEVTLTPLQGEALQAINTALINKGKTILLHGVTGSGKTEVYLRAVEKVLSQGQSALVLVPEISLVPQMSSIFLAAFPGRVAVLHSGLGDSERAGEYRRVLRGEADVVVGARSAVFAPLNSLGLIIVDEEHEQSYKQDENPKYHVREVAQKRAEMCGAAVVLGSATPSLESYALALTGKYKLVTMLERVAQRKMPSVEIIDLREELVSGNRSIFSRSLTEKMEERFRKGEQVILFLNRRGYSTFVICRECGYVAKCPHCDITLTYHFGRGQLRCHYCNHSEEAPQECPACSSRQIRYFGLGTQRVEQEIVSLFPSVKALRLDADATGRKGAHQAILDTFKSGKAQVLIGTQMVTKGLDFPGVTLVGVISADTTLNMPDFRAKERTFQLLAQVAGRAGRGQRPGEVVVQTFSPDDPSIVFAHNHDYQGFFHQEVKFRQSLGYPPFNHMLRVVLSGSIEDGVIKAAHDLGGALRQQLPDVNKTKHPMEILGPAPSPLNKLRDKYRWQVILKGKQVMELKTAMGNAIKDLYRYGSTGGIALSLDLDPMGMM